MSVLIKGMEMPKPGRYEAVIIVLDKSTAEIAISPAEDDIGYLKEYPFVPVPKHGRLIDADAFAEKNKYFWNLDFINPKYSETLSDLVEAAPTIIPETEERNDEQ